MYAHVYSCIMCFDLDIPVLKGVTQTADSKNDRWTSPAFFFFF